MDAEQSAQRRKLADATLFEKVALRWRRRWGAMDWLCHVCEWIPHRFRYRACLPSWPFVPRAAGRFVAAFDGGGASSWAAVGLAGPQTLLSNVSPRQLDGHCVRSSCRLYSPGVAISGHIARLQRRLFDMPKQLAR